MRPQFQIQPRNHGDVRRLPDSASSIRQPFPQLLMIVDLAVAGDHHAGLQIENRLFAVMHAADGQPRRAKHGRAADPRSDVVGSAVRQ